MSPQPAPAAAHSLLDRAAPMLVLVAVLAALVAPRLTHAAVAALALLPIAMLAMHRGRAGALQGPWSLLVTALAVFGIYIAANAGWSVSRGEAFGKVLYFWVLLAVGIATVRGLAILDDASLGRLICAVMIALGIGVVYLLFELVTDLWIHRTLATWIPALRSSVKHMKVANDAVITIGDYFLNRNLAVLSLALWPALLMVSTHLAGATARFTGLLLFGVAALAVLSSQHETSMLALVFGVLAFGGLRVAPHLMRPLIIAGWVAATLFVVPLALWSYQGGLHQATWIPDTGRQRIVLWNEAAERVLQRPLLGVGVAATKEIDDRQRPTAETRTGHGFPQRTGRHSHNVFMQTWYELGAIGAMLLMLAGVAALHWMGRLPAAIQPYAHASFVAAVMTGAFSYGLWQTWFMAAFGLSALLLATAVEAARRREG